MEQAYPQEKDARVASNVTGPADVLLSHLTRSELIKGHEAVVDVRRSEYRYESRPHSRTGAVIAKIEDILESILDCILDGKKQLTIQVKSRHSREAGIVDDYTGALRQPRTASMYEITFPGKTQQEAWRFTCHLRILALSHEALVTGLVITKRDIYYQDPDLFMKQAVVDRYVDNLAFTLGVERDGMNIVAAAKGLVCGDIRIFESDGTILDCRTGGEGTMIPSIRTLDRIEFSDVCWVAIIEKEASFRTLADSRIWDGSEAGKGIFVTAKGYPDIQTRAFLRRLTGQYPSIPVFAIVDFDPDGMSILSTYKHGSESLAHENAHLIVPRIKWLGIRSSDLLWYSGIAESESEGLLELTARDRRLAIRMLERPVFQELVEAEWRRELQVMLMLNMKAEIQISSHGDGGLSAWFIASIKAYLSNAASAFDDLIAS